MKTGVKAKEPFAANLWMTEYDVEIENWKQWATKDRAHSVTAHRILTSLSILAAYVFSVYSLFIMLMDYFRESCNKGVKVGSNVILDDD